MKHWRPNEQQFFQEVWEQGTLLRHLYRVLTPHRVLGGVIAQLETSPMILIAPGSSPVFGVTPEPAGVVTSASQAAWSASSSDNSTVTITPVTTDDTGLTATATLPETINAGAELMITWTYTNADGKVVSVTGIFPVFAAPPPPPPVIDVTGGTLAQVE